MFDPAKAAEENKRINAMLMKEPEYDLIVGYVEGMKLRQISIDSRIEQIKFLQDANKTDQEFIDAYKLDIKDALLDLESSTGFFKAPGLAHLMTVPAKLEVKDYDAVPAEFVKTKMTSSVDKVKLNKAIAAGFDTNVNWLEKIESYKTVVIE